MPEPRQPQRQQPQKPPAKAQLPATQARPTPQTRQPAVPARREPPKERPVPHDTKADHLADDRIHVGDAEAAGRRVSPRPIRPLAPADQAPPVESARKIRRGQVYWIMGSEELPRPRKGKIVRLSNEPGKTVGVEFAEPVGGIDEQGQAWGAIHTCDGRGKEGYCLYVRPDQVLDDKAMQAHQARLTEQLETIEYEEYDELPVGPEDSQPISPAPLGLPKPVDEAYEDPDYDEDEEPAEGDDEDYDDEEDEK